MAKANVVVRAKLEDTVIELRFNSIKIAKEVREQLQKQNFDVEILSVKTIE